MHGDPRYYGNGYVSSGVSQESGLLVAAQPVILVFHCTPINSEMVMAQFQ